MRSHPHWSNLSCSQSQAASASTHARDRKAKRRRDMEREVNCRHAGGQSGAWPGRPPSARDVAGAAGGAGWRGLYLGHCQPRPPCLPTRTDRVVHACAHAPCPCPDDETTTGIWSVSVGSSRMPVPVTPRARIDGEVARDRRDRETRPGRPCGRTQLRKEQFGSPDLCSSPCRACLRQSNGKL